MKTILILVGLAAYGLLVWRTSLLIGAFCGFGEREDKNDE